VINGTEIDLLQCAWKMGNSLTSKRAFFGASNDLGVNAAAMAGGLGIYYDSAVSANWLAICRTASTGSPVDTGIAVPIDTYQLITIQKTVSAVAFYVNGTLVATITTNIPTGAMNCGFRLETLAASTSLLHVGYFGWEASLATPMTTDDFLEV
jgi:hypothetical protein